MAGTGIEKFISQRRGDESERGLGFIYTTDCHAIPSQATLARVHMYIYVRRTEGLAGCCAVPCLRTTTG